MCFYKSFPITFIKFRNLFKDNHEINLSLQKRLLFYMIQNLEKSVSECLENFYRKRLAKINELKFNVFLKRKNPYLLRALGTEDASQLVEYIMRMYLDASDETIFGNEFFEPIAKEFSGGTVSPSESVDIAIENQTKYTAYAIKSGPHWGNVNQHKKQNQDFIALRSRLLKTHKQFDAVIGHGYGTINNDPENKIYRNRSGQRFWEEITGDKDFHVKLIIAMKTASIKHKEEYKKKWQQAKNKFTLEFSQGFCDLNTGTID